MGEAHQQPEVAEKVKKILKPFFAVSGRLYFSIKKASASVWSRGVYKGRFDLA
jgi:hypothetical protein